MTFCLHDLYTGESIYTASNSYKLNMYFKNTHYLHLQKKIEMLVRKKKIALRITITALVALISVLIYNIYQFRDKSEFEHIPFWLYSGNESILSNLTIDIRHNASGPDEVLFAFDIKRTDTTRNVASIYQLETPSVFIPQTDSTMTSCSKASLTSKNINYDWIYVFDDSCQFSRHYKGDIFGKSGTHFKKILNFHYFCHNGPLLDYESTKVTLSNINDIAIDRLFPIPDFYDVNSVTYESEEKITQLFDNGLVITGSSRPGKFSNLYLYLLPGLLLGILLVVSIKLSIGSASMARETVQIGPIHENNEVV